MMEVNEFQPTLNIAMLGHVSNGKSETVYKITGIKTQKFSSEKLHNKTIKLGYANAKIFKCKCESPSCYKSFSSDTFKPVCKDCGEEMELKKHVSFVDCPGHNQLMATMLNSIGIVDTSILVESVSNSIIPAPQTAEHLVVTTIVQLPTMAVCINKLDLVSREDAEDTIDELRRFVKGTPAEKAPFIPMVAHYGYNVDVLLHYICQLEEPKKDTNSPGCMIIVRSFNVNRQNVKLNELIGGVVGGSILGGQIKKGQTVKLLPGIAMKKDGEWTHHPLESKVVRIKSENNDLEYASPGGLIALQLEIDPGLTTQDKLSGNIVVTDSEDFKVYNKLLVDYNLIGELDFNQGLTIEEKDEVFVNVNSNNVTAIIEKLGKKQMLLTMKSGPVCSKLKDVVTISKKTKKMGPRLMGRGTIRKGIETPVF